MRDMEVLLLEQFIEKDYGDDLLLLTATDEASGRLVGLIFWRYMHGTDDQFWQHVKIDWAASIGPDASEALVSGKPISEAFTVIELLCTDRAYRGRGIGKLLLVAALAYSAVKDGKSAAVLTLGSGDDNVEARHLYEKLGFEQMPEDFFKAGHLMVQPKHILVLWDIKRSLKDLTIGDFDGQRKGTEVPQLTYGSDDADGSLRRLNSHACAEVVEQLTGC
eukprot:TRINITY_DN63100_c0_g1_i1.p1 TRINITY_DN63100_c0_g1~~TRINITY_DN63100_c0_g1_i1.p1  ORF type:complete len:220 (-),score=28.08 TRINITY_DN63100_c0_g1_i1:9-668(-)